MKLELQVDNIMQDVIHRHGITWTPRISKYGILATIYAILRELWSHVYSQTQIQISRHTNVTKGN
jgi:hypothetical protein